MCPGPHKKDEIDISLIAVNLRLSYEQRIQKNNDALKFIRDLKIASGAFDHAKSRQPTRPASEYQN